MQRKQHGWKSHLQDQEAIGTVLSDLSSSKFVKKHCQEEIFPIYKRGNLALEMAITALRGK